MRNILQGVCGFAGLRVCALNAPTRQRANAPTKLSFLFFVCSVLVLTGCSASYNGERLFWKAQQVQAAAFKNKKEASQLTPAGLTQIIRAYENVMHRVPGSIWAARAQGAIGTIYVTQKQYGNARDAYGLVVQNFSQFQEAALGARVAIAKTYELEQQWDEAITYYNEIADRYPWSEAGLSAPLYVAVLQGKYRTSELATQSYERAVGIYTKRFPDAPAPELAIRVKGYLAIAYQRLNDWNHAVATLEELLKVPAGVNRPLALLTLGIIYDTKLHMPEKAIAAYSQLLRESPEHPMGKLAKVQLERLNPSTKTDAAQAVPAISTPAMSAAPRSSTTTQ